MPTGPKRTHLLLVITNHNNLSVHSIAIMSLSWSRSLILLRSLKADQIFILPLIPTLLDTIWLEELIKLQLLCIHRCTNNIDVTALVVSFKEFVVMLMWEFNILIWKCYYTTCFCLAVGSLSIIKRPYVTQRIHVGILSNYLWGLLQNFQGLCRNAGVYALNISLCHEFL